MFRNTIVVMTQELIWWVFPSRFSSFFRPRSPHGPPHPHIKAAMTQGADPPERLCFQPDLERTLPPLLQPGRPERQPAVSGCSLWFLWICDWVTGSLRKSAVLGKTSSLWWGGGGVGGANHQLFDRTEFDAFWHFQRKKKRYRRNDKETQILQKVQNLLFWWGCQDNIEVVRGPLIKTAGTQSMWTPPSQNRSGSDDGSLSEHVMVRSEVHTNKRPSSKTPNRFRFLWWKSRVHASLWKLSSLFSCSTYKPWTSLNAEPLNTDRYRRLDGVFLNLWNCRLSESESWRRIFGVWVQLEFYDIKSRAEDKKT